MNEKHKCIHLQAVLGKSYPVLCVNVLLVKFGVSDVELLPLGMAFLRRRTQVAMSTFI